MTEVARRIGYKSAWPKTPIANSPRIDLAMPYRRLQQEIPAPAGAGGDQEGSLLICA